MFHVVTSQIKSWHRLARRSGLVLVTIILVRGSCWGVIVNSSCGLFTWTTFFTINACLSFHGSLWVEWRMLLSPCWATLIEYRDSLRCVVDETWTMIVWNVCWRINYLRLLLLLRMLRHGRCWRILVNRLLLIWVYCCHLIANYSI